MAIATFDLLKAAEEHRHQADKLRWEGTFADYLEIVKQNPRVAGLAHARVYDMIMAAGAEDLDNNGVKDLSVLRPGDLRPGPHAQPSGRGISQSGQPPPRTFASAS
jgi:hypothetical protein